MPVTITIKERKVNLTSETSPIVNFYAASLTRHQIRHETGDQSGPKSAAALGDTKSRQSFWARYVTATVETITHNPYGAKFLILPSLAIDLEAPAEMLLRSYLAFLNNMLITQGLNAANTEYTEINSRYVLIRELLYRLVGIALSNRLDPQHDGDNLLNALRDFIVQVTDSEKLIENTWTGTKKVSNFLSELTTTHPKWINKITRMISVVKIIRSNCQTVSNILNWLKDVERIIQRQLIVFIDEYQEPAALSPEWLDTTLEQHESRLLANARDTREVTKYLEGRQHLELTDQQCSIISNLPNNKRFEMKKKRIIELYAILNQTHFLYEMITHLDLLMTYTSWMPILAGVIDFNKLAILIKNYNQQCTETLEIPKELKGVLAKPAGRGLVRYRAVSAEELSFTVLQHVEELNQLQDSVLERRIGNMIVSAVSSLVRLQTQLEPRYHFVDIERINYSQLLPVSFQPLPARAIEWREKLQSSEAKEVQFKNENNALRAENERLQQENRRILTQTPETRTITQLLHTILIDGGEATNILVLDRLKEQGADLSSFCNQQNPCEGYTALHIAASTDNLVACEWIIKQGVDVNILDVSGETALDKASKRGLLKIVNFLREQGGTSKIIQKFTQQLHEIIDDEAITEEDASVSEVVIERLSRLVQNGADVNGVNEWHNPWQGDRPLHTLLVKGNQKLIHWFMGMGANPDLKDGRREETPYQRFCRVARNQEVMKEFLMNNYPGKFFPMPEQAATMDEMMQQGGAAAAAAPRPLSSKKSGAPRQRIG